MSERSKEYRAALQALTAADVAFGEQSIREFRRLMPETVGALIFRINDTPRLAFDALLDVDGEEFDADSVDLLEPGRFDDIDEVAMQMGIRDAEDASNWFEEHDGGAIFGGRFILTKEDRS